MISFNLFIYFFQNFFRRFINKSSIERCISVSVVAVYNSFNKLLPVVWSPAWSSNSFIHYKIIIVISAGLHCIQNAVISCNASENIGSPTRCLLTGNIKCRWQPDDQDGGDSIESDAALLSERSSYFFLFVIQHHLVPPRKIIVAVELTGTFQ